ncbi:hypothetical protein HDV00_009606 [Rhizophlyctis rosea]|nr:hypothetical protein HDV00_009606 [Rhizophlyctis rosea]
MLVIRFSPTPPHLDIFNFFGPSFACLLFFGSVRSWMYTGVGLAAGKRLGMEHPLERSSRFGGRRDPRREDGCKMVSSSWVGVEEAKRFVRELRNAEPRCEVSGMAWKEDPSADDGKTRVGKQWKNVLFERWEDRTEDEDLVAFERVLDTASFQVLKITIALNCVLETTKLNDAIDAFKTEYENNSAELVPITPTRNARPPKQWTENEVIVTSFRDPFPLEFPPSARQRDEGQEELEEGHLEEKILFVYRGSQRPWWAERRWYRVWYWGLLGGFWEIWAGSGYKILEKEVVVRKTVF